MNKRIFNLPVAMVVALFMSFSAGCGSRMSPVAPDAPVSTPTPVVEPTPVVTPTPTPTVTPTPVVTGQLKASVTVKNGSFLGIGACVANVTVVNDSAQALTGELKVQFSKGGKADASHLQTKSVTLQAGEQQNLSFQDPSWTIDNATVEVVTQNTNASSYGSYSYY